ncbi:Small ribosomal subunit biogenesis [Saxophila tyrrhenica]|uniref:Small ribosomal subunit biogenesis n=1 Tax=Saxophila tyrrhenica TaxID=1690608 RepID=A0AAV9NVL1_9PEZI|nr:Small ribosomal subunit biogenesis [Saxophila tyrrhenica]
MKLTTDSSVPVYTIAGEGTSRPLPEWLARRRKRSLKKDSEYANRVELLQDFEFEEASQCVRVSEDGEWVVSTGTYKPQIHTHYLPHLSLSYARHTNTINQTFLLLSSDYSKSLHLQTDRCLEFHTPGGLHYTTRIPRYGRDLKYNRRTAEALIPTVGVNADGNGEVFRLNLEVGRFMKGFEVDVGGDDFESFGGGALQGGIRTGSVNCAAVADDSHGLLAFGTSLGTVELWDSRSRNRVSAIGPTAPAPVFESDMDIRPEITALEFHPSGLDLATGNSNGIVHTYDLRSPVPLLRKDQGYGSPIETLRYLTPSITSSAVTPNKLLSADRKSIKLFDSTSGDLWTSVEPAVDLNHVEWVPDSGMLLTANEGRQQYAFFIPQLGPAPKWCGFLDNLVEEMAEDGDADPNGFSTRSKSGVGEVYDNFKFVDQKELRELNLDHLIGTTNVLRPYMHGYFVPQGLWEQARLLANPDIILQQRQKSVQEKIDKERESRIRGNKKVAVKVNRHLAERLAAREEANERRKAMRLLKKRGEDAVDAVDAVNAVDEAPQEEDAEDDAEPQQQAKRTDLMADDRFKKLFADEDFEIDEASREFQMHNPSSVPNGELKKRGVTAVEDEAMQDVAGSDDDESGSDEDEDAAAEAAALRARQRPRRAEDNDESGNGRIGSVSYKKTPAQRQRQKSGPKMQVSSSNADLRRRQQAKQSRSFGDLATSLPARGGRNSAENVRSGGVVGEKEVTFAPMKSGKNLNMKQQRQREVEDGAAGGRKVARGKERRSASGNTFRKM